MSSSSHTRLYAYCVVTLLCGVFSLVYELFSHGVYSNFMVYLFTIPLLLGVLPELLSLLQPTLAMKNAWQRIVQAFAVATLTVGALLQGVVEIYGTSNQLIVYYFGAGIALLAISIVLWLTQLFKSCSV